MSQPVSLEALTRTLAKGSGSGPSQPTLGDEDFDNITDFYCWDSDDDEKFNSAFCFMDSPVPIPVAGTPVGDRLLEILHYIRATSALHGQTDFQVNFNERWVFRGHRETTVGGVQICLRRTKEKVPRLQDLQLAPYWREILNSDTLTPGGLVILAAKPGSGKSTTIAAMIRSRLEKFGGFCKTIEAPPELPLQNKWGNGVCFQIPVDETAPRDRQFADPMRALLRGYPSIPGGGKTILVVGETRDPETAAEVVQASVGHLVITTMHALDMETTLSRFCGMAGRVLGDAVAREMTASAIRVVANQSLERVPDGMGWKRLRAVGDLLYSSGASSPVANAIREGRFAELVDQVKRQKRRLETAYQKSEDVDKVLEEISANVRKDVELPA